jgi:hypothetical protein
MNDVPRKLREMLLDISLKLPAHENRAMREYAMASSVIRQYIGRFPSEITDSFMCNEPLVFGEVNPTHMRRVINLADYIFSLRSVVGFDVLIDRISNRDLRASFFEARAAKYIFDRGFSIEVKQEVQKRGEDFDFKATRDGLIINIEVTEIRSTRTLSKAIFNKLNEKRSQVPAGAPAIFFVTVPPKWGKNPNLLFIVMKECLNFFSRSQRINGIWFQFEDFKRIDNGICYIVVEHRLAHPSPRFKIDMDFFFSESPTINPIVISEMRNNRKNIDGAIKHLMRLNIDNVLSYVEWVNTNTS